MDIIQPPEPDRPPVVLQVLPSLVTGGVERGTIEITQAVAEARTPVAGAIDAPPQYAPLSQQAQPPGDYTQPVPRHGAPGQP